MNDPDTVPQTEKGYGLLLHRGEPACLHLNEQIVSNQVYDETVDGDLDTIARSGIPPLQRCVEWLLPESADVRNSVCHIPDRRHGRTVRT